MRAMLDEIDAELDRGHAAREQELARLRAAEDALLDRAKVLAASR
jgi:hypothetical protein